MATVAPAAAEQLRVQRLAPTPDLRERWRELALASECFDAAPEWVEPWVRHVGREGELHLYGVRRGDELIGVVPLHLERRRGISLLRYAGHEPADTPGPACTPEDLPAVLDALAGTLQERRPRWDVFLADRRPIGERCPLPGPSVVRERYPEYSIEFDESGWDGYEAALSSKLRKKLRHDERRLAEIGARYDVADLDDPLPVIDELLALHDERWPGGSRYTMGPLRAFQREMLQLAAERGWLRVRRILVDGTALASHASIRFGRVEHGYVIGRKMDVKGVALGYVAFRFELRQAFEEGATFYRYGYGEWEHKRRFANRRSDVETVAYTRTLKGRLVVAAQMRRRRRDPAYRTDSADADGAAAEE